MILAVEAPTIDAIRAAESRLGPAKAAYSPELSGYSSRHLFQAGHVVTVDHDPSFVKIMEDTHDVAAQAVQGPTSCAVLKDMGFNGI